MKNFALAILLAAIAAAPSYAQSPAPMPGGAMPAERQQMMQMHQQLRVQILNALTPAHRALLATVAGSLATSTQPDYSAAASKLDAALSSGEKQAILSAVKSAHARMQSMMRSGMRNPHPMMQGTPDPGRLLLMIALMPAGGMMDLPPMR